MQAVSGALAGHATAWFCQFYPESGQPDPTNAINMTGTDGGWGKGCWGDFGSSGGPTISLVKGKPCMALGSTRASGTQGV